MTTATLAETVAATSARSAWDRGVRQYAVELLEDLELTADDWDGSWRYQEKLLLNGAADWHEYSHGGCALIYDQDIAERLCTPSELRRINNVQHGRPNHRETWLDCQARALYQAAELIRRTI